MADRVDAVVIGSGPNGLAAAIVLARAGRRVVVIEKHSEPGGGARTAEGPSPGFYHDVCSSVFPMALASPFFRELELEQYGLEWVHPEVPLAHPLDGEDAVIMSRSVEETAEQFPARDGQRYRRLFDPLLRDADAIFCDLLKPPGLPRNPFAVMRLGWSILSGPGFSGEAAKALFAGNAAHSLVPLNHFISPNAIGLMLMLAGHRCGWPFARGGAGGITKSLVKCLIRHGGEVRCDTPVASFRDLPEAKQYLFDTSPGALAAIAGERLKSSYCARLKRFRHGPGVFKIDYALSGPVPWSAAICRRAGTVHLGGRAHEIAAYERACWEGKTGGAPFILCAQPSLFDPSRAPAGQHVLWAYCHVPQASAEDMTVAMEEQIERFAPGFRTLILARKIRGCGDWEAYNPNLVGGDVTGGANHWRQLLGRPVFAFRPHRTTAKGIFLCSASTPPGAGVHGMCGFAAAREALKSE